MDLKAYTLAVDDVQLWVLKDIKRDDAAEDDVSNHFHHTHSYMEIFVCCQGEIMIQTHPLQDGGDIGSDMIHMCQGDCVMIPAAVAHHRVYTPQASEWYTVGFSVKTSRNRGMTSLYKQLIKLYKGKNIYALHDQGEFCENIRTLCNTEHRSDSPLPVLQFVTYLLLLMERCPRQFNLISGEIPTSFVDSRLSELDRILSNRYAEGLTGNVVAAMLHISERHLNRLLHRQYGMSFQQVLLKRRLNVAAYLLRETDKNLSDIAAETGFSSYRAFRSAFVKKHGVFPQIYRQRSGENSSLESTMKEDQVP